MKPIANMGMVIALTILPLQAVCAGTITCDSCEFADVAAAVSSAATGDTVRVPAGSATWESSLIVAKGIVLKGARA